jgi:geranylgeranyl pyrophosphate synthase
MGGIAGKANGEQLGILKKYGKAVGLAFQLADDILDEEEDAEADGPPSYVKLLGREKTTNKAKELSLEAISQANRLPNPEALIALAQYTISRKI